MNDQGVVFRRCGCRDKATGRQLLANCGRLTSADHGRWYFAAQAPTPAGRQTRVRRGGFDTRAEAERARMDFVKLPSRAATAKAWTVRRWLEYWLSEMSGRIRPSTMRSYREHVQHYLVPHLGSHRLSSLRTAHIQAIFRTISAGQTRSGRLITGAPL